MRCGRYPSSCVRIGVCPSRRPESRRYLNRVQSSRRLERETQRNVELIWLTDRLMPDFKTIADFRKDNGNAIRGVCREFIQ
jgi:transposase